MKKTWIAIGCLLLIVAGGVWYVKSGNEGGNESPNSPKGETSTKTSLIEDCGFVEGEAPSDAQQAGSEAADDDAEEPMTEEEKKEAEEEKRVDDFDNLTDSWMEPATNGVTVADVDAFVKRFATVPKDRKEECLQRALNLIPDENVMLLVGVLMDKSQDKELVELVFNDILNRDEDVKQPILQQIFKDKTHPCWADVAWILDVTDEAPEKPQK